MVFKLVIWLVFKESFNPGTGGFLLFTDPGYL